MKTFNFNFRSLLVLAVLSLAFVSCEKDDSFSDLELNGQSIELEEFSTEDPTEHGTNIPPARQMNSGDLQATNATADQKKEEITSDMNVDKRPEIVKPEVNYSTTNGVSPKSDNYKI